MLLEISIDLKAANILDTISEPNRQTYSRTVIYTKDGSLLPIQITCGTTGGSVNGYSYDENKKGIIPGSQTHKQLSAEPQPKFC